MANVLKEKAKVVRSGRKPTHPYQDWFAQAEKAVKAGGSLELVRGEDFASTTRTMRHNLYRVGKDQGLKVETAILTSEDGKETITINDIKPRKIEAKKSK